MHPVKRGVFIETTPNKHSTKAAVGGVDSGENEDFEVGQNQYEKGN